MWWAPKIISYDACMIYHEFRRGEDLGEDARRRREEYNPFERHESAKNTVLAHSDSVNNGATTHKCLAFHHLRIANSRPGSCSREGSPLLRANTPEWFEFSQRLHGEKGHSQGQECRYLLLGSSTPYRVVSSEAPFCGGLLRKCRSWCTCSAEHEASRHSEMSLPATRISQSGEIGRALCARPRRESLYHPGVR
jgi:hypothetical protein